MRVQSQWDHDPCRGSPQEHGDSYRVMGWVLTSWHRTTQHGDRPGRRCNWRPGWLRGGNLAARRPLGCGTHLPAGDGRFQPGRQDGCGFTEWQKPDWGVPPAEARPCRSGRAQYAAGGGNGQRACRSYQACCHR